MRRLQRLDVRLQEVEHHVRLGHRPELAVIGPRRILGPHLQDDLQRLAGHVAVLAGHAVDVEHRPVARQAGGGDAEIEPAFGEMVEHRHAVGEFGGMMIRQQEAAGTEPDVLGLQERLRQQQVRRRMRLPGGGVVLADPGFLIAELVRPAQHLQIPVVALFQPALRRMRRHGEIADLHGGSSPLVGSLQRVLRALKKTTASAVPSSGTPFGIGTSRQFTRHFRPFDRSHPVRFEGKSHGCECARLKSETRPAYFCGPESEISCSARNTLA